MTVNGDLTAGEIRRRIENLERRVDNKVNRELHDRDYAGLKEDVAEIKDQLSWMIRLVVAQFLTVIVGLIFFLLNR